MELVKCCVCERDIATEYRYELTSGNRSVSYNTMIFCVKCFLEYTKILIALSKINLKENND